jgi:16S rRNA (adenine(1408)-N(1))-methyltransferase
VLFLQAAVEALPEELNGLASQVTVQFPWGSLLRGVLGADEVLLGNLRRLCSPLARLIVTVGLDPERDRFEWERLDLPRIQIADVETILAERYHEAGFRIVQAEELSAIDLSQLHSSWARRLNRSPSRSFLRIVAEAEQTQ